ncbi:hypothetical protein M728_005339 (plasmid) [Ensifer sp. WSM1721]
MTLSSIRKVYQGVADRRQMFRMFDRHAQRPNRCEGDDSALYRGEWFETDRLSHDYMFEILPPLFMRGEMFAMREFLTGSITSVFFALRIDGRIRYSTVIATSPTRTRQSACAIRSSSAKPVPSGR